MVFQKQIKTFKNWSIRREIYNVYVWVANHGENSEQIYQKTDVGLAIAFTNNNMYTGPAWEQSFRYMSYPIQLTLLYAESIRAWSN